ncbi:MAG TPA: hemerythrin domain-containing protein [Steroidobacteraceae bacterium]|nr:hemerythrin domain-containing protein [Steroidobacteraceae bacterium]
MSRSIDRRSLILGAGGGALAATFPALTRQQAQQSGKEQDDGETEVTANEDLMREHGVIRRALFVYGEASRRARNAPGSIPLPQLLETAQLFRTFAEDYHERQLEEAHIFPVVRRVQGPVAGLPDVLLTQHQRGRQITDYIRGVASSRSIAPAEAERLAKTLDEMIGMYGPHAAREDTDLFPAWKKAIGEKAYDEMGEKFEEIERRTFGHDGFEEARARIGRIEAAFGLAELSRVTPPPLTG